MKTRSQNKNIYDSKENLYKIAEREYLERYFNYKISTKIEEVVNTLPNLVASLQQCFQVFDIPLSASTERINNIKLNQRDIDVLSRDYESWQTTPIGGNKIIMNIFFIKKPVENLIKYELGEYFRGAFDLAFAMDYGVEFNKTSSPNLETNGLYLKYIMNLTYCESLGKIQRTNSYFQDDETKSENKIDNIAIILLKI